MAKKSSFKIPGLSFSWKRAFGITKAKRKIAKATGIPTTKAGRRNKVGKILGIKQFLDGPASYATGCGALQQS